jgi:RNA polymerase sigma-70 factor (ECF subfamily)
MNMPEVADNEQLPVAQARAGEPAAWDALFRRFQLPLYVYVFELVRDEQAALDIVQEAFIAAARHLGGLRREVLCEEIPESPDDYADGPDDLLIRSEAEAEFMNRLNQLPPPQRSVLLLHYLEDFSLEEIGRITATPAGTVKSRLHYARKSLRKLLEQKP